MAMFERYTHGHHESVLRTHSWRNIDNSAAYLEPHLKQGLSLLDVGSGPGTITIDFARRLLPGTVVGIDAAQEVVTAASDLAAQEGVENVTFQHGDAYVLDFADDSFDIVHTHQTLQHVCDPVAVLRQMRRVAKPGGIVAAREVDYAGTVWFPQLPGLDLWMRVYQSVHRSNGGEPNAGRRLKSWALTAGLSDVAGSASVWCFASDEERAWWGGAWAARTTESAFGSRALETAAATKGDLAEISAAWLEWAASPEATLLMPHAEILARV